MPPGTEELREVTQRFFRRFGVLAAECTPCGKPLSLGHAHALMVLLRHGELTQRSLAAELCIDKSNVARLCSKMARAGQVKQRANEHDGRSRVVSLTASGARLAREVDHASEQRFRALLERVPKSRRAHVVAGLRDLVSAIDAPRHGVAPATGADA